MKSRLSESGERRLERSREEGRGPRAHCSAPKTDQLKLNPQTQPRKTVIHPLALVHGFLGHVHSTLALASFARSTLSQPFVITLAFPPV